MGSENDERGMPLDDYLSEAMALLQAQPDAEQILVERLKRQRFAEADGAYDRPRHAERALTTADTPSHGPAGAA